MGAAGHYSVEQLRRFYEYLLAEGTQLAGRLTDLAQRAAVYHHIYEHSGRNHIFPLIAAHGALWARGYFQYGMRLGWWLSWQYALAPRVRQTRLAQLSAFADAFRDINRRVCVETYASYHFTARFGDHPEASQWVSPKLLAALGQVHAARRSGAELSTPQKRGVFEAFFLNEQRAIVGPSIAAAVAEFDWPAMRCLALAPRIRFAYFPAERSFRFRNFSRGEERIERGLRAFDLAAAAGWDHVVAALRDYAVLPEEFFRGSAAHFAALRQAVLAGPA